MNDRRVCLEIQYNIRLIQKIPVATAQLDYIEIQL